MKQKQIKITILSDSEMEMILGGIWVQTDQGLIWVDVKRGDFNSPLEF